MRRPTSLTLRLTLLFSGIATVVLLTFGWVIDRAIENHFDSEDIKELKVITSAVQQSMTTLQSNEDMTRIKQRFDDILVGHHGALLHITDAEGNPLYKSAGQDFSSMPRPDSELFSNDEVWQWADDKNNYRILIKTIEVDTPVLSSAYTITIAVDTDFHLHFISEFHRTLWLMVISGITVMGLMGWIAVRQGHRPLHRIVEQISQISANKLNTRLSPETVPVELTELAASFNELLQRMEEAFTRLSHFSDDIAHELRTPVTNLMTQTQVALSQARNTTEYQEILYSNMEEYERMAQMVGDMLFLAKADNGQNSLNPVDIDLESEIRNLFDYYEAWAEESQVTLTHTGNAKVQGEQLMLRRALSNLLSNAIRHTPAGGNVNIQVNITGNNVLIDVQNPCEPIPAKQLSRLFDRFYRIDPSRPRRGEGAGLGLAIVRTIIEAHGGSIVATSDEAGTQFRISLPAINEQGKDTSV